MKLMLTTALLLLALSVCWQDVQAIPDPAKAKLCKKEPDYEVCKFKAIPCAEKCASLD